MAIVEKGQGVNVGETELPSNVDAALTLKDPEGHTYIQIDTDTDQRKIIISAENNADGSTGADWVFDNSGRFSPSASGTVCLNVEDPSATNPNILPNRGDPDTGIGSSGADALSLIAGGVEIARCVTTNSNAEFLMADEVGFISDPDCMMRRKSTNSLEFRMGGTDIFGIDANGAYLENGNLGVGTLTPATKLHVQGAVTYYAGTGSDTATSEPVYLADTNGTMIIDFDKGNFGDITLAANVTAIKLFNAPADGSVTTVTAKITQDSSARTFDYSDSAVTVYSDGGSTAVTGEIKFAGGAHHVQSTGSGAVDLVSFTCIPNGSTFNIYAAVIGQAFA